MCPITKETRALALKRRVTSFEIGGLYDDHEKAAWLHVENAQIRSFTMNDWDLTRYELDMYISLNYSTVYGSARTVIEHGIGHLTSLESYAFQTLVNRDIVTKSYSYRHPKAIMVFTGIASDGVAH